MAAAGLLLVLAISAITLFAPGAANAGIRELFRRLLPTVAFASTVLLAISLATSGAMAAEVPADFRLEYARGPCEGSCPDYSVRLDAAGRVTWQGKGSVARIGRASKTLPRETVLQIVDLLGALQLSGASRDIRCIDAPQLSIAIRMNRNSASTEVASCGTDVSDAARRVLQTVRSLDRLVGVESWVGSRPGR